MSFSMALVFCYRFYLDIQCYEIEEDLKTEEKSKLVQHICRILKSCIQAPVQISVNAGAIKSLFSQEDWVERGSNELEAKEMRIDARYIFTTVLAAGVWLWSMGAGLQDELENDDATARGTNFVWQACIGTLWCWMVS